MDKIDGFRKWSSRLIRFFGAIYAFVGVALRVEISTGRHWVGMLSIGISLLILGAVTIAVQYRLEELSHEQLLYGFLLLLIPQVLLAATLRTPHSIFSIILVVTVLGGLPVIGAIKYSAKLLVTPKTSPVTRKV